MQFYYPRREVVANVHLEMRAFCAGTMIQTRVSNLAEITRAVRVDPRDSREYAGSQQASPLFDICHQPAKYPNVRYFDHEMVVVDDANAKVNRSAPTRPARSSLKLTYWPGSSPPTTLF
jgi:hypothetical protein